MKRIFAAILILTVTFAGTAPAFAFTFRQAAQLKNAEEPFIDLAGLIGDSKPGKEGNEEAALPGDTDQEADDDDEADKTDGTAKTELIRTEEQVELVITVRDREITVNGVGMSTPEALGYRIRSGYKPGMTIRLIDDYAEYNTYTKVLEILDELDHNPVEEKKP